MILEILIAIFATILAEEIITHGGVFIHFLSSKRDKRKLKTKDVEHTFLNNEKVIREQNNHLLHRHDILINKKLNRKITPKHNF